MVLKKGQRIEHDAFGPGVITSMVDGGRRARVEFDKLPGIPYTLPTSQLDGGGTPPKTGRSKATRDHAKRRVAPSAKTASQPVTAEKPPEKPLPAPSPSTVGSTPSTRQLFEALRMGVVPPALLDRYTVGRDDEIRRLADFVSNRAGMMVIEGHYGTGKTHLIALAAGEALKAGYLTSRISFDAVEVPPSNPLRIYRELMSNLRYPPEGTPGGLTPLLSRLITSRRHKRSGTAEFHRYLSPALYSLADGSGESSEAAIAFVEGRGGSSAKDVRKAMSLDGWRGPKLLALPDWRTFGQVLLYLVGGIAAWAQDAGFAGLALFFDEAESIDHLEGVSRQFAETVVRYFSAATLPDTELPFDAGALYRGGQAVHRGLPHRFRAGQPLLSCFAFTPLEEVSRAVASAGIGRERLIVLDELTPLNNMQLVSRLIGLYRELHPELTPDEEALERLERHVERGVRLGIFTNPRQVTRLTVEYLDLLRHRPEKAVSALEEL